MRVTRFDSWIAACNPGWPSFWLHTLLSTTTTWLNWRTKAHAILAAMTPVKGASTAWVLKLGYAGLLITEKYDVSTCGGDCSAGIRSVSFWNRLGDGGAGCGGRHGRSEINTLLTIIVSLRRNRLVIYVPMYLDAELYRARDYSCSENSVVVG